jgi:hypothetical protein
MATMFPTQGEVRRMIAGAIGELTGTPAEQIDLGPGRVLVHEQPRCGYNWSFSEAMVKARFRPFVHRAVCIVRDRHPILK